MKTLKDANFTVLIFRVGPLSRDHWDNPSPRTFVALELARGLLGLVGVAINIILVSRALMSQPCKKRSGGIQTGRARNREIDLSMRQNFKLKLPAERSIIWKLNGQFVKNTATILRASMYYTDTSFISSLKHLLQICSVSEYTTSFKVQMTRKYLLSFWKGS